jgi:predicted Fe-Mo cluster-binding NifX family protein
MTKICVTSSGPTLESPVDPRFGRCAYFIIVDTETHAFEAVSNEAAIASGGAGIQAARIIVTKGIEAVLTGSVGPNAFPALEDSDIKILVGVSGTVKSAIESYASGSLEELVVPGPANVGKGQGGPGRGLGGGYGTRGGRGGRGGRRGGRNW